MSSIQQILASILNAVYGKDVRQAIHDGVEMAYNKADDAATSAAAAAEAASGSQESAAASAQAASNSASSASDFADAAEQYKNEAFHTTPAGYEAFVGEVNSSLDYLAETGVKNLLPNTATSKTENGITYTVNSDGTVTVNGTATAFTEIKVFQFPKTDLVNTFHDTYHLSGAPVGAVDGDTNGFKLYASTKKVSDDSFAYSFFDTGNGVDIETSDTRYLSPIYIAVNQGITVNNVTFKPMLTRKGVSNSDYAHYVPYAQSNAALTEEINSKQAIIIKGKNDFDAIQPNSYMDKAVAFGNTLPSTPKIIASLTQNPDYTDQSNGMISIAIVRESTTGFTIRAYNNSSISRTPEFNWIAVL